MSTTVDLKCRCGGVTGKLKVVEGSFFHVQCLCCDCQKFANYLESNSSILDEFGSTELFQTYPTHMQINEGVENIACVQLAEKGLYRWHTTCCNFPIGNTMDSAKMPFVGIPVAFMQFTDEQQKLKTLGPITMKAFAKYAIGSMPNDAHPRFPLSFMPKIIFFMLKGMLTKKSSPSPFFKEGRPLTSSKIIS